MIPTTSIPSPATTDFAGPAKAVAVSETSDIPSSPTAENEFSQEMENALIAEMGFVVEGLVETEDLVSQTPANPEVLLDSQELVDLPSANPSALIAQPQADLSEAVAASQTSEGSLGLPVASIGVANEPIPSTGLSNVPADSIEGIVSVESPDSIVPVEQLQGNPESPSLSDESVPAVDAPATEVGRSQVPASNTPAAMKQPADGLTDSDSSPNNAPSASESQAEGADYSRAAESVGEPSQSGMNQGTDSDLENALNSGAGDGAQKPANATSAAGAEELQSAIRDVPTETGVTITNPGTVSNANDAPAARTITDTSSVTNQVAEHVISAKQSIRDGGAQLEVTLDPPELGRITIKLVERDSVVEARLTVSESTTIELIRESMPKLVDSLSESGIFMGDFHLDNAPRDQRGATSADRRQFLEPDVDQGEGSSQVAPERLISRPGSIDILVQ